jgi:hypothetical protein
LQNCFAKWSSNFSISCPGIINILLEVSHSCWLDVEPDYNFDFIYLVTNDDKYIFIHLSAFLNFLIFDLLFIYSFSCFVTKFHYAAQAGFELAILLPLSSKVLELQPCTINGKYLS